MRNRLRAVTSMAVIASIAWLAGCAPSKVAATLVLQMEEAAPEKIARAAALGHGRLPIAMRSFDYRAAQ